MHWPVQINTICENTSVEIYKRSLDVEPYYVLLLNMPFSTSRIFAQISLEAIPYKLQKNTKEQLAMDCKTICEQKKEGADQATIQIKNRIVHSPYYTIPILPLTNH